MMAALVSGSSKPKKLPLVTMPDGGTSPRREPGGYTTSAASMPGAPSRNASRSKSERRSSMRSAMGIDLKATSMAIESQVCDYATECAPQVPSTRTRDAPQGEIDPPALRQQGRGARHDAVDAVKGEPRVSTEHPRRRLKQGARFVSGQRAANRRFETGRYPRAKGKNGDEAKTAKLFRHLVRRLWTFHAASRLRLANP